jgi:hypothetical protein
MASFRLDTRALTVSAFFRAWMEVRAILGVLTGIDGDRSGWALIIRVMSARLYRRLPNKSLSVSDDSQDLLLAASDICRTGLRNTKRNSGHHIPFEYRSNVLGGPALPVEWVSLPRLVLAHKQADEFFGTEYMRSSFARRILTSFSALPFLASFFFEQMLLRYLSRRFSVVQTLVPSAHKTCELDQ